MECAEFLRCIVENDIPLTDGINGLQVVEDIGNQTLPAQQSNLALEALIFAVLGFRRGWVVPWREGLVIVFALAGAALGWGMLALWDALT